MYREKKSAEIDSVGFMTPVDENCSVCLHVISNPMGEECYLRHLDNWLFGSGMGDVERRIILEHIRRRLPQNNPNQEMCIVCGEEYLSICSYCFVSIVSRVLEELDFGDEFVDDFEYTFSYRPEGEVGGFDGLRF